jgi:hypothetical protein
MRKIFSVIFLVSLIFCFSAVAQTKSNNVKNAVSNVKKNQQEVLLILDDILISIRTKYKMPDTPLSEKYHDFSDRYNRLAIRVSNLKESQSTFKESCLDLFSEWKREAEQIHDKELKNSSLEALADSKAVYDEYSKRLDKGMDNLHPIQQKVKDNVIFIKHRLNAETIEGLDLSIKKLANDIDDLISDFEKLLEETNQYISSIK